MFQHENMSDTKIDLNLVHFEINWACTFVGKNNSYLKMITIKALLFSDDNNLQKFVSMFCEKKNTAKTCETTYKINLLLQGNLRPFF